ncbi:MAG: nitroreductase family protein [Clostridiales bacterium]|nr:nitroreductase family protein [Clostridiales bacterium]
MLTHQEYYQAALRRRSRRAYRNRVLDKAACGAITRAVEEVNAERGLSFQFITDGKKVLSSFVSSYGFFSGLPSYIAVVGPNTPKGLEDCGYYGERLDLECVHLGLGTCWVGGTYQQSQVKQAVAVGAGEKLFAVIAVGWAKERSGTREKLIYRMTHQSGKTYQQMIQDSDRPLPEVLIAGMELVEGAPSAVNRQPCVFRYRNGVLSACVQDPETDRSLDLGIAKFHFELGVRHAGQSGHWNENNEFVLDGHDGSAAAKQPNESGRVSAD